MYPDVQEPMLISKGRIEAEMEVIISEERPIKERLAHRICEIIKEKGLSDIGAIRTLCIDQAKLSDIMSGRIAEFTLDHLFHLLNILGYDIEITVKPKEHSRKGAGITIIHDPQHMR
jgi:predicted XRE-type DNA-binding protein